MNGTVRASSLPDRDLLVDNEGLPEDLARIVSPLLKRMKVLVPTWLRTLIVQYDNPDDTNNRNAYIQINTQYREATLTLCGPFFSLDDRERLRVVCHEFAHLWMVRITDACHDAIVSIETPSPTRKLIESNLRRAEEYDVDDLSWFFLRLLEDGAL